MKYLIEWTYENDHLQWNVEIKNAEINDVKDFLINWMTEMMQDLFTSICQNLKKKSETEDITWDKIISVVSLVAIMCQSELADKLTKALNTFLWDIDSDEDDSNQKDENPWDSLYQL